MIKFYHTEVVAIRITLASRYSPQHSSKKGFGSFEKQGCHRKPGSSIARKWLNHAGQAADMEQDTYLILAEYCGADPIIHVKYHNDGDGFAPW